MQNSGSHEAWTGINISREISVTSECRLYHPYGRKWGGTEEPLDESERGEWKSGLKLKIQKTKIMASNHITSWRIEGETLETVRLILGAPKSLQMVTAAIKLRHLLLGRKGIANLDSILKSRENTLLTNFHLVKAMVFPVVIYGCESWTVKKAERWRIDAFELWRWRRLLRVPWTARRSTS